MVSLGVCILLIAAAFFGGCSVGMLINEGLYIIKRKVEKRKEESFELKGSAEDESINSL